MNNPNKTGTFTYPIDSTIFDNVTRSVDQLCTTLSLTNINVPRFNNYSDCYEFLREYETVTATLSDEQRALLLVKSFPIGYLRVWYDEEIAPLVTNKSEWKTIRAKILNRFPDTEDKDRHFARLRTLKYEPSKYKHLADFIEDISYSYSKAYGKN